MRSNTKNAKGSGTIRKRSDGRWEARYTTGIDPKTGKQTQKSVYGKTQKEVRQKHAYTPDLEAVMEKYDPSLFCLNDDARMTDEDRLRVRQFLGKLFPEKSSFEK